MNFDQKIHGPFKESDYPELIEMFREDLVERNLSEKGVKVRLGQFRNLLTAHCAEYYQEHHEGLDLVGEEFLGCVTYINAEDTVRLEQLVVAKSGNCFTPGEADGTDREFIMAPEELEERKADTALTIVREIEEYET